MEPHQALWPSAGPSQEQGVRHVTTCQKVLHGNDRFVIQRPMTDEDNRAQGVRVKTGNDRVELAAELHGPLDLARCQTAQRAEAANGYECRQAGHQAHFKGAAPRQTGLVGETSLGPLRPIDSRPADRSAPVEDTDMAQPRYRPATGGGSVWQGACWAGAG